MPSFNRYFLFEYPEYYPSGGVQDLVGTYPTFEEAKVARIKAIAERPFSGITVHLYEYDGVEFTEHTC